MPTPKPHVLLVDDEEDLCALLSLRLEHHGFRVTARQTVHGALEVVDQHNIDSVVLDIRLDNENGLDFITEIRRRGNWPVPVIILTADGLSPSAIHSVGDVHAFLTKPFDASLLIEKIRCGLAQPKTQEASS